MDIFVKMKKHAVMNFFWIPRITITIFGIANWRGRHRQNIIEIFQARLVFMGRTKPDMMCCSFCLVVVDISVLISVFCLFKIYFFFVWAVGHQYSHQCMAKAANLKLNWPLELKMPVTMNAIFLDSKVVSLPWWWFYRMRSINQRDLQSQSGLKLKMYPFIRLCISQILWYRHRE